MTMDAKNAILASIDLLAMMANSVQDIVQLNVMLKLSMFAPHHQKMDALKHQPVKPRKKTKRENTAINNFATWCVTLQKNFVPEIEWMMVAWRLILVFQKAQVQMPQSFVMVTVQ